MCKQETLVFSKRLSKVLNWPQIVSRDGCMVQHQLAKVCKTFTRGVYQINWQNSKRPLTLIDNSKLQNNCPLLCDQILLKGLGVYSPAQYLQVLRVLSQYLKNVFTCKCNTCKYCHNTCKFLSYFDLFQSLLWDH